MKRSEDWDSPIDIFEQQYEGHKCVIDFKSVWLHDYGQLEEYADPTSYLRDYRGCGFDESNWEKPERMMRTYSVKTNRNKCSKCPHAESNCAGHTCEGYMLPENDEEYLSCPLEEDFTVGTAFVLRYPRQDKFICNHCGRRVGQGYSNDVSTPEILDVRYRNRPGRLIIEREEALCSCCGKRLKATLIPGVQIDSGSRASERLVCAIGRHSLELGIAGLTRCKIAEGYGMSRETLRKYMGELCEKCCKAAEASGREAIRAYNRKKAARHVAVKRRTDDTTYFHCATVCFATYYDLTLYFSASDPGGTHLSLSAAFDKKETDVIDAWMHGDFLPNLPHKLSYDHLVILSYYYASTAFPNINQTLAFYMVELVVAYGKFLKNGRGVLEDPKITEMIRTCLKKMESGEVVLSELEDCIFIVREWSNMWGKRQIYNAARKIQHFLERKSQYAPYYGDRNISFLPCNGAVLQEMQEKADRIGNLIAEKLRENELHQNDLQEDIGEGYETDSKLTILRLLYINPAAAPEVTGHLFPNNPFADETDIVPELTELGVPVRQLEALLQTGLLNNEGKRSSNLVSDGENRRHK